MMDKRRPQALHNVQLYQAWVSRAFNKKVKPTNLQEGDKVLKEIRVPIQDPRGKFVPIG